MSDLQSPLRWTGTAIAMITIIGAFFSAALWLGNLVSEVKSHTQELARRGQYVDQLQQILAQVADLREEQERRRLPTYRIETIERDLERLEKRLEAYFERYRPDTWRKGK